MSDSSTLDQVEAALSRHFGQKPDRASVSFVGVDSIEILRFEPIPGERVYLSLGMSRHTMTGAAELIQSYDGPRAELMLQVRDELENFAQVWRRLALMAASPSVEGIVYRTGMTVDLGEPLTERTRCVGALVASSPLEPVATDAGLVDVLRVIPATATELAWCRIRGSEALQGLWRDHETDLLDLGRNAVPLA